VSHPMSDGHVDDCRYTAVSYVASVLRSVSVLQYLVIVTADLATEHTCQNETRVKFDSGIGRITRQNIENMKLAAPCMRVLCSHSFAL